MHNRESISWHERASALTFRTKPFIDGRYVDTAAGATFDSINPATGKLLARVAAGDTPDVDRAVKSARAAFNAGSWAGQAPAERKTMLLRFAELILKHGEELALLETLDMGKPITRQPADRHPRRCTLHALVRRSHRQDLRRGGAHGPDALALVTREPMGVVGAIVPWNFPLLMAAWKFAPVAGRGQFPGAQALGKVAADRDAPGGARARGGHAGRRASTSCPDFGAAAGKALALHMDVDCIAFTGSTATGKLVMQYAGQSNLKRVSLECGGKSPNIVLADYPDLDRAAQRRCVGHFLQPGRDVLGRLAPAGAGGDPRRGARADRRR